MKKFLTIDIGGSLIKYGIIDEDGTLLYKSEIDTEAHLGGPSIINKVKKIGETLLEDYTVEGICVSTAGQVDSRLGKVIYATPDIIPDYTGLSVKEELESFFKLPTEVENDVNCVGLAESWLGKGKNAKSLFCLTVGTGIGGSYILDNQLHTGFSYSGGEIGYMLMNDHQTLQQIAATSSLIEYVSEKKKVDPSSLNGKIIFEQAKKGDQICIDGIDRMVKHLSKGISTIIYMMNPEMVVIGGGISAQESYLKPLIYKELEKIMVPAIFTQTSIEFASNMNNAGLIGALRNFLIKEALHPINKIITSIDSNRNKLTKKEQIIADYILNNLSEVPNLTINEMAKKIGVGEASISRFTKKIDVGSFNNLRMLTSRATASKKKMENRSNQYHNIKTLYDDVITRFEESAIAKDIDLIKQTLMTNDRFFLVGKHALEKELTFMKDKLLELGFDVQLFTDISQRNLSKKIVNDSIKVLVFDVEGYDGSLVDYVKEVNQVTNTVGITSQTDSPLARQVGKIAILPFSKNDEQSNAYEVSFYFFMDLLTNALGQVSSESIKDNSKIKSA
ncbi:ROK family protein [Alkalibacterium sp. 20]|uniref:ROK family protein n=1 Tax=Alkalibacterium sp. 20 TaxID=1798803 RepID=UPI0008FFE93F|nr:ROK family protein [Alkalibacterium sp. 20]